MSNEIHTVQPLDSRVSRAVAIGPNPHLGGDSADFIGDCANLTGDRMLSDSLDAAERSAGLS